MNLPRPGLTQQARLETLRWGDGVLELIDQRLLPLRFEYRRCSSASEVAEAISTMVVRGAPAIGVAAAYGVALEVMHEASKSRDAQLAAFERAFVELAASRPTAVNLTWALNRQRAVVLHTSQLENADLPTALLYEAHSILHEDIATNQTIGRHGAELIKDGARILTHCNAGALATAGHGTALGVIRSAIAAGKRVSVFADETRPLLQGARLTAWELAQDGIPVTVIADSAAAFLMKRGEIDVVLVGADRVAANGDTANKIGTYPLAVLAQRHAVPFYVACPLSTIDPALAHGDLIPIEERSAEEVTGAAGVRWTPPGIAVRNPAFDVTPAALISALITERGVLVRPDRDGLAALLAG
jgi:methylthioribose-1-phosphate isomerase